MIKVYVAYCGGVQEFDVQVFDSPEKAHSHIVRCVLDAWGDGVEMAGITRSAFDDFVRKFFQSGNVEIWNSCLELEDFLKAHGLERPRELGLESSWWGVFEREVN